MARFGAAGRSTGAGSATLPVAALVGGTTARPRIAEIGVFNTTSTACAVAIARQTGAGTPGAAVTVMRESDTAQAPIASCVNTYTGVPSVVAAYVRQASLGAAVGSGVIFTFGPTGLVIPDVASAGVGIVVPTGTGQILDFYFAWDE